MPLPRIIDVPCLACGAPGGTRCVTSSGKSARETHTVRNTSSFTYFLDHCTIVETLEDDERLGIKAGEQYIAKWHRSDPWEEVSLLARFPDEHALECDLPWGSVKFIRWATTEESKSLL